MNFDKYKLLQFANQNLISIQSSAQFVPNFSQSRTCKDSVKDSSKMAEQTDREARAARRNLLREAEEEEDTGSSSEEVFIILIFLY